MFSCSLTLFSLIFSISIACADIDGSVGLTPWDGSPYRKKEKSLTPDMFLRVSALHFGMSETELVKLWNRGYGRNELIKLVLLSRESKQELSAIAKVRDKNTKFAKIAEKYNVDYAKLTNDAAALRKDIDYKISVSTFTIEVSTVTEKSKQH